MNNSHSQVQRHRPVLRDNSSSSTRQRRTGSPSQSPPYTPSLISMDNDYDIMAEMDQSKSESSLYYSRRQQDRGSPVRHVGGSSSFNGKTLQGQMHDDANTMGASWCAGSRRRTASSSNALITGESRRNSFHNNNNTTANNSSTPQQQMVQRHHSGDSTFREARARMTTPLLPTYSANSGARQRPSPQVARSIRMTPRRNLTGDFDVLQGEDHSLVKNSNHSSPHRYGMLNPGYGKHHHHHHHHKRISYLLAQIQTRHVIALIALCSMVMLGVAVYQHDAMLQEALAIKELEVEQHAHHNKELEKRVRTLRTQTLRLEDNLETLRQHAKELQSEDDTKLDLETKRKLFHLEHSQLKVQADIQAMSQRLVQEKFGFANKYYVEMKLNFHDIIDNNNANDNTIILETAPIDIMPHSVYLFLEQVSHQLYDGTTFHRSAAHLVQAGPSNHNAHAKFRKHPSLNSVMFQEYAPEMAHKAFTLGYPGRPGGPDFYVNLRDNSAVHGPGGQHHHYSDIVADADPCFAKIVSGFNVVERIHRSPTEPGGFHDSIVKPVEIVSMRILPNDYILPASSSDSPDDSEDYDEEEIA